MKIAERVITYIAGVIFGVAIGLYIYEIHPKFLTLPEPEPVIMANSEGIKTTINNREIIITWEDQGMSRELILKNKLEDKNFPKYYISYTQNNKDKTTSLYSAGGYYNFATISYNPLEIKGEVSENE